MTQLYASQSRRIHAFALSRLRDPAAAADVLSEVMVEAWRQAGRFEGRSRVSTWLLGIAHHKVVDELRRRGARRVDSLESLDPAGADDGARVGSLARDPVEALDAADAAERLRRCLETLGDAQREAVHLAFFEDLSCAEIADVAKVPVGTVKTRIFHAKRLLARCLGGASAADGEAGGPDAGA